MRRNIQRMPIRFLQAASAGGAPLHQFVFAFGLVIGLAFFTVAAQPVGDGCFLGSILDASTGDYLPS